MAHGVSEVLGESRTVVRTLAKSLPAKQRQQGPHQRSVMGSRRIFPPAFKVKVLDSYRNDEDCKLNQRATARKFNIHRRQIQKWLQNEQVLRDACPELKTSAPSSEPSTPADSPPRDQPLLHQPLGPTPASPALNLSRARLHGDKLVAQPPPPPPPQQQQQQQQPPPPPVAQQQQQQQQQQSSAAQALASVAQQPDYRFQVSPTAAIALAAAGYPDFKADLPILQPVQRSFSSAAAGAAVHRPGLGYPGFELYGPLVYQSSATQQPGLRPPSYEYGLEPRYQSLHSRFLAGFEPRAESSTPSASSASPSPRQSEDEHRHQQQRRGSLVHSADIKTERASPDYPATPSPCGSHSSAFARLTQASRPRSYPGLKRERPDEEEQQSEPGCGRHLHGQLGTPSLSCSPAPSLQPEHLESLPLSPDRSSASSDSDMEQVSAGSTDLARRRSFSLRFKLEVLDAFHSDKEIVGNQRATARKYNINRRQVQKWLIQETELRGVIEMCGSDSRQRLGPAHESGDDSAVDLRKALATDLGQISPSSSAYGCDYALGARSPGNYIDSSLTPPYSTPGCSLSCCQEPTPTAQPYYCYSPGDLESLKRPVCTQSCCLPPAKKLCTEESRLPKEEPEQESPLCLVKPKSAAGTVPSPPAVQVASKKDAILFKPYLDNPVSRPSSGESLGNTNCQIACNPNEQQSPSNVEIALSFKLPANYRASQQQAQQPPLIHHPTYLDIPPVRSAFVRYPSSVHYS